MNRIHFKATAAWVAGLRAVTSKCTNCDRSLALRHLSAKKAGIKMHGCWYCSSICFARGVETRLASLQTSGAVRPGRAARMPLGLILVSQGLLTRSQFKEVLDKQKVIGGEIGDLLARHSPVTERQVAAARSTQWGCPTFAVPKNVIENGIQIPSRLIQLYSAMPLHYVTATKQLLVGFVNNIEYGLLYAIEQMTGCKTQPCFITPSDFQIQLQQREWVQNQTKTMPPKEVMFEEVQTPAKMADVLCDYAADLEAEEITIGRLSEYLWARFKCDAEEVDVLFRAA